jgi:hypothetical protein
MINEQFAAELRSIESVMLACPASFFKKDSRQAGMTVDVVFTYELFSTSLQFYKESFD